MGILDNYNNLKEEIKKVAIDVGRDPEEIEVVAISKTFPTKIVQEAIDAGIGLFGENKVQEAKGKIQELKGDFQFHMVGHLQSNKAKDAVSLFDLIHSIDKLNTALRIDKEAEKIGKKQKILLQVNTSGEDTKSGVQPGMVLDICNDITELFNIQLCGLMTIGPMTRNNDMIRDSFRMLKQLLNDVNESIGLNIDVLSMGMSSDYKIAIEEGSTMLRVGTAIFGERNRAGHHA
ncbi:MAG: YggS family pyridoxal phosphate-dependent enzyme [Spirochaetota bacterium]|nr:YggS family pyridoxal phosphate-dependent enzyme [Spirochaetota bacterium]